MAMKYYRLQVAVDADKYIVKELADGCGLIIARSMSSNKAGPIGLYIRSLPMQSYIEHEDAVLLTPEEAFLEVL